MSKPAAIVVLGCRIVSPRGRELAGAAGRRARAAAEAASRFGAKLLVATGGRAWSVDSEIRLEAEALEEEMLRVGVDGEIVREGRSRNTRENARFTRAILERREIDHVVLVTCSWHMARAEALFRAQGLAVEAFPASVGNATRLQRAYRAVRERVAARLDVAMTLAGLVIACALLACGHGTTSADASTQNADATVDGGSNVLTAIEIAEDTRRADAITDDMRTSRDVKVRRHAARALSRIADMTAEPGLFRALADEDIETVAWAAYGLGFSCKGHEDVRVRALASRAISIDLTAPNAVALQRNEPDVHFAISRALGRCGGALAESTLAEWVRGKSPAWREDAAFGIGDIAARRGSLGDDTITALLDAAGDGVSSALYPFSRTERFNDAFAARLLDVARKGTFAPKSDARVFAVRALAKVGVPALADLSRIATTADYSWSERIDAMRSLGKLGDPGHVAAAEALTKIFPDALDPFAILAAGGDLFGEIVVGLIALGQTPPAVANHLLTVIASARPAGEAPVSLARRFADIRCTAASLLAQGAYDAAGINACDVAGTEAIERAKLQALLRRPIIADRRTAWLALTKSEHIKIREDALGAIGLHKELGDVGIGVLANALGDTKNPGIVASATDVIVAHPDRVLIISARERKNALDPNAPPPTAMPEQEASPVIAKALAASLAFAWSEDAIETRAGLIDAAAALHSTGAKESAKAACADPNITIRDHAAKALHALGDDKATCPTPPNAITAAKETSASHGGKLVLTTDAGTLSIIFDADVAPIASTRLLDLAKGGFLDGNVVHRVVPAFVVQLGDPHADGYGGSGKSLRCETSPLPFGPLDVGIALAGRDTGSSQFFVTLARFPHLDGDYARIGHAEGDWFAVAEGDVVQHAKVE